MQSGLFAFFCDAKRARFYFSNMIMDHILAFGPFYLFYTWLTPLTVQAGCWVDNIVKWVNLSSNGTGEVKFGVLGGVEDGEHYGIGFVPIAISAMQEIVFA